MPAAWREPADDPLPTGPERPRSRPAAPPPRPPVMRSPVVRPPTMKPGYHGMPIAPPQYRYPPQRYAQPVTPYVGGTVAMPVPAPGSRPVSGTRPVSPIPYPGLPASAPPVAAGTVHPVHPFIDEPLSDRSGVVAGILQLLLGWVGAGRLYTGHVGIALAQFGIVWVIALLTLCIGAGTAELWVLAWLGVAWPTVDGVILLCGGQRDRQGRRLR